MIAAATYPQRIVCLTAETAEILWRLDAWDKVVGVSGFTTRPPEARKKPKVGGFTTVYTDKVMALKPDLVVSFSDLQAEIVKDLIAKGCNVLAMNQRSLQETLDAVLVLGSIVGKSQEAQALVEEFTQKFDAIAAKARAFPRRPRVYFEEWPDPIISGIRWVSEIIEIAGGQDIFPELREHQAASSRIVSADEIRRRDPEVIIASWCGKKVQKEKIVRREGWSEITAIRNGRVHEIKSAYILQPGPILMDGLQQVYDILAEAVGA